jgi:hypothetical protein
MSLAALAGRSHDTRDSKVQHGFRLKISTAPRAFYAERLAREPVDDLDAHVLAVTTRGLEPAERLTYSNGARKALYRDPAGSELRSGGAPLDSGS